MFRRVFCVLRFRVVVLFVWILGVVLFLVFRVINRWSIVSRFRVF